MKLHLLAVAALVFAGCSGASSSGTGASGSTGAGTTTGAATTTSGGSSAGTTTGTNSGSATTTTSTSSTGSIGTTTGSASSSTTGASGSSGASNQLSGGQAFAVSSALAGYARDDAGHATYAAVEAIQTDLSSADFTCTSTSDAGAFQTLFHAAIAETFATRDGGAVVAGTYNFNLLNALYDAGGYTTELVLTTQNAWPDGGGPRYIAVQGSVTYDALGASQLTGSYEGQLVDYWAAVANSIVDAGYVTGTFDATVCQ